MDSFNGLEAVEGGTRMLQSIQFNGSGPPTYVYSKNAVGASGEYYHVFAAETRGYDDRQERRHRENVIKERENEAENSEHPEFKVMDNTNKTSLQEAYQKEYRRRESFLWKLK